MHVSQVPHVWRHLGRQLSLQLRPAARRPLTAPTSAGRRCMRTCTVRYRAASGANDWMEETISPASPAVQASNVEGGRGGTGKSAALGMWVTQAAGRSAWPLRLA